MNKLDALVKALVAFMNEEGRPWPEKKAEILARYAEDGIFSDVLDDLISWFE